MEPLLEATEEALAASYAQQTGSSMALAQIDRETGQIALWERRTVSAVVSDPKTQIALSAAPRGYEIGDMFDVPVDPSKFGRLAAQAAKSIVAIRVLEHERERVFQRYRSLEGTVLECLVQRVDHGRVYVLVDSENEAVLPFEQHAISEGIWINDLIRCSVDAVRKTSKGPAIFLGRTSADFFRGLISEEVQTAGRDPGRISKIVCRSLSKASRATLRDELRGETVEQVRPYQDTFEQIEAAFAPLSVNLHDRTDLGILLAIGAEDDVPALALEAGLVGRMFGKSIVVTTASEAGAVIAEMEERSLAPVEESAPVSLSAEALATLERFAAERAKGN